METTLRIDTPWKRSFTQWLYANVIGTVLLGLYLATQGDRNFALAPIVGLFAAGISLPIIPLCLFVFNQILPTRDRAIRLLLSGLAITGLFTVTMGITALVNIGFNLPAKTIIQLAFPYFFAALIATAIEYSHRLFRTDG